jgi:signal transduction histidine kinase
MDIVGQESELRVDHVNELAELIGAAVAAATKSYVEHRDVLKQRALAESIAFMTHELRSPLQAAVLGAFKVEMEPLTHEAKQGLDVIKRNHARLLELIDKVIATERFEATQVQPKPEAVPFLDLVQKAARGPESAARAKGIQFSVTPVSAIEVTVDPTLTVSALENLIQNAVKYTDAGEVCVSVRSSDRDITVDIRDSCGGLSTDNLEALFEPFYRGQTGKPGSGLGLAIARRAAEAQGGSVVARALPGGCQFSLTLPRIVT